MVGFLAACLKCNFNIKIYNLQNLNFFIASLKKTPFSLASTNRFMLPEFLVQLHPAIVIKIGYVEEQKNSYLPCVLKQGEIQLGFSKDKVSVQTSYCKWI